MAINERSKAFAKVLLTNFAILLIFLFSPALLFQFCKIVYPRFLILLNQSSDKRAYYPTYENNKFSIQLLNEFNNLTSKYKSFIGWRRENVEGKYTNISGSYNVRKSKGEGIKNSVWFFGGSTMWGTGASDLQTIPSHFNSITNKPVYNFGETGWTSRQSLNQLINVIGDEYTPSLVVFYDGVNDVVHQCRSEIKILPVHSREKKIQNVLKPLPIQKRISKFILSPYIQTARKFSIQFPMINQINSNEYDCEINQAKARTIAKHLVNNWQTAYAISKSKGFKFYGILQPTLFTTKTNSEYFPSWRVRANSDLEIQFRTIYPLILQEIERYCESDKNFCSSIINGTDWLDGTDNIFIDFCHINSLGNKVIAKSIQSILKR
tara:strand:+ start:155 stop:1291 length:1137 start_codon:yes stop_codon:yes gene_type:complete